MANPNSLGWASLLLAIAVATIATLLALGLWRERRTRQAGLSDVDRKHYLVQDLRRGVGILLMALLAPGLYIGSRLPTFVLDPGDAGPVRPAEAAAGALVVTALRMHPNRQFLAVWLGVFGSIVALLALALIDWMSTRRFAGRQRREMDRERIEILVETLRYTRPGGDGLANGQSYHPS